MRCILCFGEEARIYWDCKERPYFYCSLCSHRIFFRSPLALKALMVWTEAAKGLTQEQFLASLRKVEQTQVMNNQHVKEWCDKKLVTEDVVEKKG